MNARNLPGPLIGLSGWVDVPTSKSLTNRALVAAAVADGGRIVSPLDCDDTRVLASALSEAGWSVRWDEEIIIGPREIPDGRAQLDLGESGTGARLLLGLLTASPGRSMVDGGQRLRERPMAPLIHALEYLGAKIRSPNGRLPIAVDGGELEGGAVEIRPSMSSQFVSSLLLAAPLMRQGLDVEVVGELPSGPYLDLTMDVLRAFGAEVSASPDRRKWRVPRRVLRATTFEVEGDWSAAAFPLAAAAVAGGNLDIGPLDCASRQGDRVVVDMLVDAGLSVEWKGARLIAHGPVTAPLRADLEQAPDLFPALAAVAACSLPGSRFSGLDHLAHKESDRLTVMIQNLERLGAGFRFDGTVLEVEETLHPLAETPRRVTAAGDHRVAMAMAIAALGAGPLVLDDGECVSKSFPGFWTVWDRLTGLERRERTR